MARLKTNDAAAKQSMKTAFENAISLLTTGSDSNLTEIWNVIDRAYNQPTRHFHHKKHRDMMMMPLEQEYQKAKADGETLVVGQIKQLRSQSKMNEITMDSLLAINGAVHDVVYTLPDKGLGVAKNMLKNIVPAPNGQFVLAKNFSPTTEQRIILDIFQHAGLYNKSESLSNELMSALATLPALVQEGGLSHSTLAQLAVMVAGTVPFKDQSHMPNLKAALKKVAEKNNLNLDEDAIADTVRLATYAANRDVSALIATRPAQSIYGSMELLAERVPEAIDGNISPVKFMQEMHRSVSGLREYVVPNLANVAHVDGDGFPEPALKQKLDEHADANMKVNLGFHHLHVLSDALVAAISLKADINDSRYTLMANIAAPEKTNNDDLLFDIMRDVATRPELGQLVQKGTEQNPYGSFAFAAHMLNALPDQPALEALVENSAIQNFLNNPNQTNPYAVLNFLAEKIGAEKFNDLVETLDAANAKHASDIRKQKEPTGTGQKAAVTSSPSTKPNKGTGKT